MHIDMTGMITEGILLLTLKLIGAAHATEIPLLAGNSKLVGGYPLSDLIYPLGRSKLFTSEIWWSFGRTLQRLVSQASLRMELVGINSK